MGIHRWNNLRANTGPGHYQPPAPVWRRDCPDPAHLPGPCLAPPLPRDAAGRASQGDGRHGLSGRCCRSLCLYPSQTASLRGRVRQAEHRVGGLAQASDAGLWGHSSGQAGPCGGSRARVLSTPVSNRTGSGPTSANRPRCHRGRRPRCRPHRNSPHPAYRPDSASRYRRDRLSWPRSVRPTVQSTGHCRNRSSLR